MKVLTFFAVLVFSVVGYAGAAEPTTICSAGDRFCLTVTPPDPAPGKRSQNSKCRGAFFARDARGTLRKLWETDLVNPVAPRSVLVSVSGRYIVTFDNRDSMGVGSDVVAIYDGAAGRLVRSFGLEHFLTPRDIDTLAESRTDSFPWGGGHRIDELRDELVLSIEKRSEDELSGSCETRIDLRTGELVGKKWSRLPAWVYWVEPIEQEISYIPPVMVPNEQPCFEDSDGPRIPAGEAFEWSASIGFPLFPKVKMSRSSVGVVPVELLIDPRGFVACFRVASADAGVRRVFSEYVRKWRFEPSDESYRVYFVYEVKRNLHEPDRDPDEPTADRNTIWPPIAE